MRQETVSVDGNCIEADAAAATSRHSNLGLAVQLLELIAGRKEPVGLVELAAATGTAKARLQRGLNGLVDTGLVSQDPAERTYAVANRSLHLAALIRNNAPVARIVAPILEALAAETGETATFNAYHAKEGSATIVSAVESRQSLRYDLEPGEAVPMLVGACGKAILAFLPAADAAAIIDRDGHASIRSAADRNRLKGELAAIRTEGFAVSRERLPGAIEFAAPVFDAPHRVVGSLGVTAPRERLAEPFDHSHVVRRQAVRLSELLGCVAPSPTTLSKPDESSR